MSDSYDGLDRPAERGERYADDQRRYRLDARLATGGMGAVWRATDTSLDRIVAIKLLKSEYADDQQFRQRFETEARHAASLHHPHVASVYDVGESLSLGRADGSDVPRPYLVMELVDGEPLSALLRGGRPLAPDAVRDLMAQAADAIGAAHRAGIVHRDVKPANLMVTPDRQVKITDFGIARASDGLGLTGTGQVMGTPQYLSPEQARGNPATPASDVYSLGVVAFECLAGHRPFDAESPVATALAHLNDPVPALPDTVPADLAAVVTRALSKKPEERFADGAAFALALRDPLAATAATQVVRPVPSSESTQVMPAAPAYVAPPVDPTPTPVPLPEPVDERDDRRSPWPIVLLLLALAAVVIVVIVLLTRGGGEDDTTTEPTPTPSETPSQTQPTEEDTPSEESSPAAPDTVTIDSSDYEGRPLDDVMSELDDLGLNPTSEPIENPGDEDADSVASVSPDGELQVGASVTVEFYDEPEPSDTPTPTPSETPSETPSPTPSESTSTPPAQETPSGPGQGPGQSQSQGQGPGQPPGQDQGGGPGQGNGPGLSQPVGGAR